MANFELRTEELARAARPQETLYPKREGMLRDPGVGVEGLWMIKQPGTSLRVGLSVYFGSSRVGDFGVLVGPGLSCRRIDYKVL